MSDVGRFSSWIIAFLSGSVGVFAAWYHNGKSIKNECEIFGTRELKGETPVTSITLILTLCYTVAPENAVCPELHDRCLSELHDALDKGEEFVKVHAAESLLWTGHTDTVREVFLKEPQDVPKYRIGVWRVLAQAALNATDRREYENRILAALLDPNGPDRLHAAETLGKLGVASRDPEILRLAKEETGPFQAMVRWVMANSGNEEDEAALVELLASTDAYTRGCTAYALRFFKTIRPVTREKLAAASEKEPLDSNWRTHLLSARYLHASAEERPALREGLLQYLKTGDTGQKREACAALGRVPNPEDIPALAKVLDDADLDARAGAAEAILLVERMLTK